jgi:hypothetical protein
MGRFSAEGIFRVEKTVRICGKIGTKCLTDNEFASFGLYFDILAVMH